MAAKVTTVKWSLFQAAARVFTQLVVELLKLSEDEVTVKIIVRPNPTNRPHVNTLLNRVGFNDEGFMGYAFTGEGWALHVTKGNGND